MEVCSRYQAIDQQICIRSNDFSSLQTMTKKAWVPIPYDSICLLRIFWTSGFNDMYKYILIFIWYDYSTLTVKYRKKSSPSFCLFIFPFFKNNYQSILCYNLMALKLVELLSVINIRVLKKKPNVHQTKY